MKKIKLIALLLTLLIACTKSDDLGAGGGKGFNDGLDDFDSDLQYMYSCNDTVNDQCTETYYETKPTSVPTCGAAFATTVNCVKTSDFLGGCKTEALGTKGFRIQTIFFYYEGNAVEFTPDGVEGVCNSTNSKYLPK